MHWSSENQVYPWYFSVSSCLLTKVFCYKYRAIIFHTVYPANYLAIALGFKAFAALFIIFGKI